MHAARSLFIIQIAPVTKTCSEAPRSLGETSPHCKLDCRKVLLIPVKGLWEKCSLKCVLVTYTTKGQGFRTMSSKTRPTEAKPNNSLYSLHPGAVLSTALRFGGEESDRKEKHSVFSVLVRTKTHQGDFLGGVVTRVRLLTGTCFFQASQERRLIYWKGSVSTVGKNRSEDRSAVGWVGKERRHSFCVRKTAFGRDSQWKIVRKPVSALSTELTSTLRIHVCFKRNQSPSPLGSPSV